MQPSRKAKLLICAAVLLMSAVLLLFIAQTENPIKVTVQFQGFKKVETTFTTKEGTFPITFAGFRVSNVGKHSVHQQPVYGSESRHLIGVTQLDPSVESTLYPGQSNVVWVMTPWEIREPWRVRFEFSKIDWQYKLSTQPPWVKDMLRRFVKEKYFYAKTDLRVFSDWAPVPYYTLPQPDPPNSDSPFPRIYTSPPTNDWRPGQRR